MPRQIRNSDGARVMPGSIKVGKISNNLSNEILKQIKPNITSYKKLKVGDSIWVLRWLNRTWANDEREGPKFLIPVQIKELENTEDGPIITYVYPKRYGGNSKSFYAYHQIGNRWEDGSPLPPSFPSIRGR